MIAVVRVSSSFRRWLLVFGWALVVVFVVVPALDVYLFGPHDHVAAAEDHGLDVGGSSSALAHGTHHCELSVSPAELVSTPCLAAPMMSLSDVGEHLQLATMHTPSVPPSPPRA